jgi:hypothetical protein
MPNAWDDQNIERNLATLAAIQPGDKLSTTPSSGLFALQRKGFFSQSVARIFSADSVADREAFSTPITILFRVAVRHLYQTTGIGISEPAIRDAMAGLNRLTRSYSRGSAGREALDRTLNDVRDIVGWPKSLLVRDVGQFFCTDALMQRLLLNPFFNELMYEVHQGRYLGDEKGVCMAFVWDWIRRKSAGKWSYRSTSKRESDLSKTHGATRQGVLRLQSKVDKGLRRVQEAYTDTLPHVDDALASVARVDPRFAGLVSRTVVGTLPTRGQRPFVVGRDSFMDIYKAVTEDREIGAPLGYRLGLRLRDKNGELHGHAVGLYVSEEQLRGGIHFFDPSIGEFLFGGTGADRFCKFGEAFFKYYASTKHEIVRVVLNAIDFRNKSAT